MKKLFKKVDATKSEHEEFKKQLSEQAEFTSDQLGFIELRSSKYRLQQAQEGLKKVVDKHDSLMAARLQFDARYLNLTESEATAMTKISEEKSKA